MKIFSPKKVHKYRRDEIQFLLNIQDGVIEVSEDDIHEIIREMEANEKEEDESVTLHTPNSYFSRQRFLRTKLMLIKIILARRSGFAGNPLLKASYTLMDTHRYSPKGSIVEFEGATYEKDTGSLWVSESGKTVHLWISRWTPEGCKSISDNDIVGY